MKITTMSELIERLEDVKADIETVNLDWVVGLIDDVLDECRAEFEEAAS